MLWSKDSIFCTLALATLEASSLCTLALATLEASSLIRLYTIPTESIPSSL